MHYSDDVTKCILQSPMAIFSKVFYNNKNVMKSEHFDDKVEEKLTESLQLSSYSKKVLQVIFL